MHEDKDKSELNEQELDSTTAEPRGGSEAGRVAEPTDGADAPVAFWADEDPDALPEVVRRKLEAHLESETASQTTPAMDARGNRSQEQPPANAPLEGAAPQTVNAQRSEESNEAENAASSQAASPEAVKRETAGSTSETPGSQPSFPAAAATLPQLPPYEETQEVGGGAYAGPRSFFRRLMSFLGWLVVLALFAAIGFAAIYYRYASDRLYNIQFDTNRTVILNVSRGDRLSNIIEKMRAEGLLGSYLGIDDAYLIKYLAWINENSHKIKTGVYRLNSSMSLSEIYEKLIAGSQDFKITIPEGKTAKETAAIIKRKLDGFDEKRFLELVHSPEFIAKLGLSVPSLEGYLYPDTYFFAPGMKEEDIIRTMVENFIKRAETSLSNIGRTETSVSLSFHEHVIIASLIEREARVDAERPLIASVIFNRLKKGMKLDIDATINYALGDWGKRLSLDDLKTSSPYNTYLHKGLPPGPICNPQMSSLIATFRPAQTNYLFYVYKGDGTHAFAETYEEHLANIRLYRRSGATGRSIPSGAGATEQSGPIVATETTGTLTAYEGNRETPDEQVGAKESNEESKRESPRSGTEQRRQGSSRRTRGSGSRR